MDISFLPIASANLSAGSSRSLEAYFSIKGLSNLYVYYTDIKPIDEINIDHNYNWHN